MPARGVEQPRELLPIAQSQGPVLTEDNQQLTDHQFTRITRTLAEPRRVRILREIAAHENSIPLACLLRRHQVSAATLSHHANELDNSGLVEIVRHGRFVHLVLRPDVWQAYVKRLSDLIDGSELLSKGYFVSQQSVSDEAKAVARRNTEEVQGKGRFDVFDELFADNFTDHTPQPNTTPDKAGVRRLYTYIRAAFPDFHAEIHWQLADGDRVTTYKTYHGTHEGPFLGVAPTHRKIHFETVDVMRVQRGKITDHWGVGNLLSLMQQIGGWTQSAEEADDSTFSSLRAR